MSQKEIEVILARQLASYLAVPIFIVDTEGTLIYYNEQAEKILGLRFAETGELRVNDWGTLFSPTREDGTPLAPDAMPLVIAIRERRSAHMRFRICGADNVPRLIEVTGFPLIGQQNRYLGAMALFWEQPES